jgi:peptide/nickel transport system ATP-binding protein
MSTTTTPLLAIDGLAKRYSLPRKNLFGPRPTLDAVAGVSFTLAPGTSFGIVGESGSGKSTLARLAMALERPSAGSVRFAGEDLNGVAPARLRVLRRQFQMVFQDPYGSLDPRHKVGRIVAEPLRALDADAPAERVAAVLQSVGLKPGDVEKYPHEFSGGQRQRIAIARALVTRPQLIVADEPVSALDVSVQAQVLNLLKDLQAEFGLSYLLISHDLGVVDYVCADVAVMYRGRIVEQGPAAVILRRPAHPYTQALRDAVPRLEPGRRRRRARAEPAAPETFFEQGCAFAGRCPRAEARCRAEAPALRMVAPDQRAACHLA